MSCTVRVTLEAVEKVTCHAAATFKASARMPQTAENGPRRASWLVNRRLRRPTKAFFNRLVCSETAKPVRDLDGQPFVEGPFDAPNLADRLVDKQLVLRTNETRGARNQHYVNGGH